MCGGRGDIELKPGGRESTYDWSLWWNTQRLIPDIIEAQQTFISHVSLQTLWSAILVIPRHVHRQLVLSPSDPHVHLLPDLLPS